MRFLFVAVVFFISIVPLAAHIPEGVVYQVFQFPDTHVPKMDGDLADWDRVPESYILDLSHHAQTLDGVASTMDTVDLNIKRVGVGWNDALNRLYFMTEVVDDVVRFHKDKPDSLNTLYSRMRGAYVHGADIWEIVIDADHAGDNVIGYAKYDEDPATEIRHRSAHTQNYHLYMPPLNGYYWHWLWGKSLWIEGAAYSGVGWNFSGKHTDSGTIIYECYLTPFDDLHPDSPEQSIQHDLSENAVIGLSWAFLDADEKPDKFDAFWTISKDMKMYGFGDKLVDFRLMPVVAELWQDE